METIRLHGSFIGLVQGVGFRHFTDVIASMLGINGTVENKGDDELEFFLEGEKNMVELMAKVIKYGPRWGRVDSMIMNEEPITGEVGFNVIIPPQPIMLGDVCDICQQPVPSTTQMGDMWVCAGCERLVRALWPEDLAR